MEDFAEFYAGSKDRVYRAVALAIGDAHGAEDAVAEAFARALARWRHLREHPNPVGWVLRTALNAHRSWWRRRRRERLGDPPDWPTAGSDGDDMLSADLRGLVWALPTRQREVVALRLLADLSAEDAGELLGVSAATVHVHLHRALATLRAARPAMTVKEEGR